MARALLASLLAALLAGAPAAPAFAADVAAGPGAGVAVTPWTSQVQSNPAVMAALNATPDQAAALDRFMSGINADAAPLAALPPEAQARDIQEALVLMTSQSLLDLRSYPTARQLDFVDDRLVQLHGLAPLVPGLAPAVQQALKTSRALRDVRRLLAEKGFAEVEGAPTPGAWEAHFAAAPELADHLQLDPERAMALDRLFALHRLAPSPALRALAARDQAERVLRGLYGISASVGAVNPIPDGSLEGMRRAVTELGLFAGLYYMVPQAMPALRTLYAKARQTLELTHYALFGRVNPPGWSFDGPPAETATAKGTRVRRPYQVLLARLGASAAELVNVESLIGGLKTGRASALSKAVIVRTANLLAHMLESPLNAYLTPAGQRGALYAALITPLLRSPQAEQVLSGLMRYDQALAIQAAAIAYYAISQPHAQAAADLVVGQSGHRPADKLTIKVQGLKLAYAIMAGLIAGSPAAVAERALKAGVAPAEVPRWIATKAAMLVEHPYLALLPAASQEELRALAAAYPLAESRPLPRRDTTVELELYSYPPIFNALTTPDGTVGSLLPGRPLPAGFPAFPVRGGFDARKPRQIRWDRLDPRDQLTLFARVTELKETDFFADRRIPGFSVKKRLMLHFDRETVFMGKTYRPGGHLVDVSKAFEKTTVEYIGPFGVKPFAGVELHFRTDDSAGAVSNDAWTLLDGLGVPRNHQHVHVVAPLPVEALRRDPDFEAARLADFYRRTNILAEMASIIMEAAQLRKNEAVDDQGNKVVIFGNLSMPALKGVARYLSDVGRGIDRPLKDAYKIAYVGFWGSDKYDEPGLYGFEYRAISRHFEPIQLREFLDQIQRGMLTQDYGIAPETFRRWMARYARDGADAAETMGKTLHTRGWEELLASAAPEVRAVVPQGMKAPKDHAIRMLVNNWSDDPLIFENEPLKRRIVAAQVAGLKKLKEGGNPTAVVADFLVDSGLYEAVSLSLGVNDPARLKPPR